MANSVTARDPILNLPIDCTLGDTCYIQNYVDHDPSDQASDFTCAGLTYNTHKGTDFGLTSFAEMERGVDVISAAPGTVIAARDGMPDTGLTPETEATIKGRECGNGLVIDHGGGWQTQYCHLKQGSLSVEKGRRVAQGTRLGLVGMSGRTEFPHVHLSVRKDGETVDPFDPDGAVACGAPSQDTLWQNPISYEPGGLLAVGFAPNVPDFSAIKAGTAINISLDPTAPGLVLWGYVFGGREGDTIRFGIDGPNGWRHAKDSVLSKNQALLFRASGKRLTLPRWPAGTYAGHVTHLRNGIAISQKTVMLNIE